MLKNNVSINSFFKAVGVFWEFLFIKFTSQFEMEKNGCLTNNKNDALLSMTLIMLKTTKPTAVAFSSTQSMNCKNTNIFYFFPGQLYRSFFPILIYKSFIGGLFWQFSLEHQFVQIKY